MARPQMDRDSAAVDCRGSTGASGALDSRRATPRARADRFAVEWALPDDAMGPVDAVVPVGAADERRPTWPSRTSTS
jgi:hypothetical protein